MAKKKVGYDPSIANRVKIGKPRTSKIFSKKGNAASRTSKRGNGHTKRKQKEMVEKSSSYQKENDSYQYTMYGKPQQNTTKWKEERERERRMKIITVVMLSLMSMTFITIIAYFATYGT